MLDGAVSDWVFSPSMTVVAAAAAVGYVAAVRALRRRGVRWAAWRTLLFLAVGLPVVLLTVSWWPGAQADRSFAAYVTQVVVLALVAPAFIVLGAPVRLGRLALADRSAGPGFAAFFDSATVRLLTHPFVTPVLILALPVVVIFSPVLRLTLENGAALAATQVLLLVLGTLALLSLVDGQVPDHGVFYGVAVFVAFFELLLDAVPGGVLFYSTSLFANGWYALHGCPGGPHWAHSDQSAAGAILWSVGEGIDVPFLLVLLVAWMRADAAEARRVDALLDAEEAEEAQHD
jgi:putative membrane protein